MISTYLEEKEINTFLLNKTQHFIDRPIEYASLLKYVTGEYKSSDDTSTDKSNGQPLMAVLSQPGDGKTMLLAKFVLDIEVCFLHEKQM